MMVSRFNSDNAFTYSNECAKYQRIVILLLRKGVFTYRIGDSFKLHYVTMELKEKLCVARSELKNIRWISLLHLTFGLPEKCTI